MKSFEITALKPQSFINVDEIKSDHVAIKLLYLQNKVPALFKSLRQSPVELLNQFKLTYTALYLD
jgi:hypothetical protein